MELQAPDPALQFQLPWCSLEYLGGFLTGQVWEVTQLHREVNLHSWEDWGCFSYLPEEFGVWEVTLYLLFTINNRYKYNIMSGVSINMSVFDPYF